MSRVRQYLKRAGATLFGVFLALVGLALLFGEYRDGAAHAHTTHVIIGTAIFGIGCLIIAPKLVTDGAHGLVMIVLDAKKGGLRWTDPPAEPPAKPKIEKPPAGAGDV